MSEKVYPDWVQKQKTTGTTVKKVGNNYYRNNAVKPLALAMGISGVKSG